MEKQNQALRDEQLQQVAGGGAESMFAGLDIQQLIAGPLAAEAEAREKLATATEEFVKYMDSPEGQGYRKVETRTFSFKSGGTMGKE